jgi:hypothetical protein
MSSALASAVWLLNTDNKYSDGFRGPISAADTLKHTVSSQVIHHLRNNLTLILQPLCEPSSPTEEASSAPRRCPTRGGPNATGIVHLPASVLRDIFLAASYNDVKTRTLLLQVCQRWRTLALGTCEIWAHIYVDGKRLGLYETFQGVILARSLLFNARERAAEKPEGNKAEILHLKSDDVTAVEPKKENRQPAPQAAPVRGNHRGRRNKGRGSNSRPIILPGHAPRLANPDEATKSTLDSKPLVSLWMVPPPLEEDVEAVVSWTDLETTTPVHIHLHCPLFSQLSSLLYKVNTARWKSLHITLGDTSPSESSLEGLFATKEFPSLETLRIDEKVNLGWSKETGSSSDPYNQWNENPVPYGGWLHADLWNRPTSYRNDGPQNSWELSEKKEAKDTKKSEENAPIYWNNDDLAYQQTKTDPSPFDTNGIGIPTDLYGALYNAIVLTSIKLKVLDIDADVTAMAGQYGLFGQQVKSLGGSSSYIRTALPVNNTYSHVRELILQSWDNTSEQAIDCLPQLEYLQVEHYPEGNDIDHSSLVSAIQNEGTSGLTLLLPSITEIRLTNHSAALLSRICAAGLTTLSIEEHDGSCEGCLPRRYTKKGKISQFYLDKWSCANIETATFSVRVDIHSLLTFLSSAFALRTLTITTPNPDLSDDVAGAIYLDWKTMFVREMTQFDSSSGTSSNPGAMLKCCPHLESLTLIIPGPYTDDEWGREARKIYVERGRTNSIRSVLLKFHGDGRQTVSGPAGCA